MALTDALGNLIDFRLLPGQAHDLRGTAALIEGLTCDQFLADRAFDANWLREALTSAGIEPVPSKIKPPLPGGVRPPHLQMASRSKTSSKAEGIQRDRNAFLHDSFKAFISLAAISSNTMNVDRQGKRL